MVVGSLLLFKLIMKEVYFLKEISQKQIENLIEGKVIRNTHRSYVDCKTGRGVGFNRTIGVAKKRYIEDKYVDIANKMDSVKGCYN